MGSVTFWELDEMVVLLINQITVSITLVIYRNEKMESKTYYVCFEIKPSSFCETGFSLFPPF
jgi:hypothetical protein